MRRMSGSSKQGDKNCSISARQLCVNPGENSGVGFGRSSGFEGLGFYMKADDTHGSVEIPVNCRKQLILEVRKNGKDPEGKDQIEGI